MKYILHTKNNAGMDMIKKKKADNKKQGFKRSSSSKALTPK